MILVTGSSGMLGSEVVSLLDDVKTFDLVDGQDITNPSQVGAAMVGVDTVVHLAAIPYPVRGYGWNEYWDTNVVGTQTITSAAVEAGVSRIVLASSTAVYGAHKRFPFQAVDMTPTGPNALQRYYGKDIPGDEYGVAALAYCCSKIIAEAIVSAVAMPGLIGATLLRLRPITMKPYGPWGIKVHPTTAATAVVAATKDTGFVIRDVAEKGSA